MSPHSFNSHIRHMGATKREEPRLRKLSAICMQLPETERKLSRDHADFRVRGKVFAYFLNNHHGDRIVAVTAIVHSSYRLAAPRKLVRRWMEKPNLSFNTDAPDARLRRRGGSPVNFVR